MVLWKPVEATVRALPVSQRIFPRTVAVVKQRSSCLAREVLGLIPTMAKTKKPQKVEREIPFPRLLLMAPNYTQRGIGGVKVMVWGDWTGLMLLPGKIYIPSQSGLLTLKSLSSL